MLDKSSIKLTICSQKERELEGELLLTNPRRTDVRRYRLRAAFVSKPVRSQIRMTTTAGHSVSQSLVVPVGRSPSVVQFYIKENSPSIKIGVEAGEERTCQEHEVLEIPVVFSPRWICSETSIVVVHDRANSEKIEYEITGVCESPLSERNYLLECYQDCPVASLFIRSVASRPTTYKVELDLGRAERQLRVPPEGANLRIRYDDLGIGNYKGIVRLYDEDKKFRWFTFVLKILPKELERISLETQVGGVLVKRVSLGLSE
jgi:hypothetical protein